MTATPSATARRTLPKKKKRAIFRVSKGGVRSNSRWRCGGGGWVAGCRPNRLTARNRLLQGGEDVLHRRYLGRLGVDDRLGQFERVRVLTVVELLLRHLDGTLMVLRHLLEEEP